MSLAGFLEEHKQPVLVITLTTVVFVLVVVFGIRFSLASIAAARGELEELADKIEMANRALDHRDAFIQELGTSTATLKHFQAQLPPQRSYYSWATEMIYSVARAAGLDISAIDEINAHARAGGEKGQDIPLEIYSLRITAQGGYESARQFLLGIEQKHPLARLTGIEISSGPKPDVHEVQIFVQWPFQMGELARLWDEIDEKKRQVEVQKTPRSAAGEQS